MGPLNDPKDHNSKTSQANFSDVQDMALQTTGTEQDLSHIQTFGCTLSLETGQPLERRPYEGLVNDWFPWIRPDWALIYSDKTLKETNRFYGAGRNKMANFEMTLEIDLPICLSGNPLAPSVYIYIYIHIL